jgi:hypothetical protein
VSERLVDGDTASSRPTAQPDEREDPITQIEERLRLHAKAFEYVRQFPNRLSDALPPAIDGLSGPHVGRLDVHDVGSPEAQVHLLSVVERLVAATQPLHVLSRHRLLA